MKTVCFQTKKGTVRFSANDSKAWCKKKKKAKKSKRMMMKKLRAMTY